MKKGIFILFLTLQVVVFAQTIVDKQLSFPVTDRTVYFSVNDAGVPKPIKWGLDLAWLNETNLRRGVAFIGADNVKIVRSSFTPTSALVNGELPAAELAELNERLRIIDLVGRKVDIMLNDDNPSVNAYFYQNAANWTKLMEVTAKHHQNHGLKVISIAPFNEPDNTGAGQGSVQDFYNICAEVRKNTFFDSIFITGPNTLNPDVYFNWYNPIRNYVGEGNTHQLAGTFDNYANCFTSMRADGKMAMNDELHNVMEAMVGVEYGLQSGIWWGTAEYARGEFCKASNGVRLAYGEHRPNWTSASVYRTTDGKIQAFGGGSERQSVTTKYRFVSKDKDVYFDGVGPQREYVMELPGGLPNTYGTSLHVSPEKVVNISWGEDIQPPVNGRYILVNRNSGKLMEVAYGSTGNGAGMIQNANLKKTYQQWDITPVDSRIGGDFTYFKIANVNSGKSPDVMNFSLDNGASVIAYDFISVNQQWYLEYAGEGYYYIRNRHSSKCLQPYNAGLLNGVSIVQWEKTGSRAQQWRLMPVDATVEFVAPVKPSNLRAENMPAAVKLSWTKSTDGDVTGYDVLKSENQAGPYNTIARNVKDTTYTDGKTKYGQTCFYKIRAVDYSMNRSAFTDPVSTQFIYQKALVAQYLFDGNTLDNSGNMNHAGAGAAEVYDLDKDGKGALTLDRTTQFVQLPADIVNHDEMTVSTWLYWTGISYWQRIFDFGNNTDQYMFLTTLAGKPNLRFAMKNGGAEQYLDAVMLPYQQWTHVAVTLSDTIVKIYVNGVLKASSDKFTIKPSDFNPALNYIGRSQFTSDPLIGGKIDDFRIYNYELSSDEIKKLAELSTDVIPLNQDIIKLKIRPNPVCDFLIVTHGENSGIFNIFDVNGAVVKSGSFEGASETSINTADLKSGMYILQIKNNTSEYKSKFIRL